MKLKPINWTIDQVHCSDVHTAIVMGVTLAVVRDKDGTYTASLSNVPKQRPELQKGFKTVTDAKKYAEGKLLKRELNKYFTE